MQCWFCKKKFIANRVGGKKTCPMCAKTMILNKADINRGYITMPINLQTMPHKFRDPSQPFIRESRLDFYSEVAALILNLDYADCNPTIKGKIEPGIENNRRTAARLAVSKWIKKDLDKDDQHEINSATSGFITLIKQKALDHYGDVETFADMLAVRFPVAVRDYDPNYVPTLKPWQVKRGDR